MVGRRSGGGGAQARRKRPWEEAVELAADWAVASATTAVVLQGGTVSDDGAVTFADEAAPRRETVTATYGDVLERLRAARAYLDRTPRPWTWWRGTRIEGAWTNMHMAHAHLVRLLAPHQLVGYAPHATAVVRRYVGRDEPERVAVEQWFERVDALRAARAAAGGAVAAGEAAAGPSPEADANLAAIADEPSREVLATTLRLVGERNASEYQRFRRFRNFLGVGALAISLIVGGLVLAGALQPSLVPLCFPDPGLEDDATETDAAGGVEEGSPEPVCPSGRSGEPTGGDVGVVVLFGLVGSALTAVRSVAHRAPPTPMPLASVRVFQATLKLTTGMLAALLGLLFLRAGAVPGFTALDAQSEIIAYAVVFGAAQQVLTRIIDNRSNTLVTAATGEMPSGEADDPAPGAPIAGRP